MNSLNLAPYLKCKGSPSIYVSKTRFALEFEKGVVLHALFTANRHRRSIASIIPEKELNYFRFMTLSGMLYLLCNTSVGRAEWGGGGAVWQSSDSHRS